jgi:hypothetical protein
MLLFPLLTFLAGIFWSARFATEKLISPAACALHLALAFLALAFALLGRRSTWLERPIGRLSWVLSWFLVFGIWNLAAWGNFVTRSQFGDPLSFSWFWQLLTTDPTVRAALADTLDPVVRLKLFAAFLAVSAVPFLWQQASRSALARFWLSWRFCRRFCCSGIPTCVQKSRCWLL